MKKIISKLHNLMAWIKGNYTDSDLGVLILCGMLSWIIASAFVDELFASLPLALNVIIAAIIVVIAYELITFLIKIFLRVKIRGRVYSLGSFALLMVLFVISSQAQNMGSVFLFVLVINACVCLLGRSACAIIRNKKIRVLNAITLVISIIGLAGFSVFLYVDGYDNNYTKEFYNIAHSDGQYIEVNDFAASITEGKYEVGTYSYGVEEEDIKTNTVDIDSFAERKIISGFVKEKYFGYKLSEAPVRGQIWYPVGQTSCPTLFIVHGNHDYTTPSYLGYEYLGHFLATNGYVVVSVDENCCNDLSNENDARAVLFLENIKSILKKNDDKDSPVFNLIDESRLCIAGHSRGGETVALAYLFNDYDVYPDNGNITFDYGFDIKGVIAIAPTVDQYQPALHAVNICDTNYFIIQGANDFDVATAMGEKQYNNVSFTDNEYHFKAMLYVAGANHGQFNSKWGKYDLSGEFSRLLNIKPLISETDQQDILKIYVKTFLDNVCNNDARFNDLFYDTNKYQKYLPRTLYQNMYQASNYNVICDFDEDSDLSTGTLNGAIIQAYNVDNWSESIRAFWGYEDEENYAVKLEWDEQESTMLNVQTPILDIRNRNISFDVADCTEETDNCWISCKIQLSDIDGNESIYDLSTSSFIYPSWPVQLRKIDYLFNDHEYKHQMQTIRIPSSVFEDGKINLAGICEISFIFENASGNLQIDNIGIE